MQNAWRELALRVEKRKRRKDLNPEQRERFAEIVSERMEKGEKLDWGKLIMRAQLEVIEGGRKA